MNDDEFESISNKINYKSKYIKQLDMDEEETTGIMYFPYINKDIEINGYGEMDVSYIDRAVDFIATMNEIDFTNAIDGTISYYNDSIKRDGYWSYLEEKSIPTRITRDIIKSFKMESIELIESNNNDIVFNIILYCPWGNEESMIWSFINNKNVYVGSEYPVNPLDDYFINNKYNYSIFYHGRVSLTDDEYQIIENNYNSKNN